MKDLKVLAESALGRKPVLLSTRPSDYGPRNMNLQSMVKALEDKRRSGMELSVNSVSRFLKGSVLYPSKEPQVHDRATDIDNYYCTICNPKTGTEYHLVDNDNGKLDLLLNSPIEGNFIG